MSEIRIYTDGGCSGNPGPAGWAAILQYKGHQREVTGGAPEATNNQAEIQAVIVGLSALKEPCQVMVFTDSKYVIGVMGGWKRKANQELLAQLDVLCEKHKVEFVYVQGHAGDPLNERADWLAKGEVEKQRGY